MPKCLEALSKNLIDAISASGLSQSEVARRAGVSAVYLNQILAGSNQSPKLANLESIAAVLRTTVGRLLSTPDELKDHPLEECYRRIGEAITREAAYRRVVKDSVSDEKLAAIEAALRASRFPAKKTGD